MSIVSDMYEAEIEKLKQAHARQLQELGAELKLAQSLHDVAVKERDLERVRALAAEQRVQELLGQVPEGSPLRPALAVDHAFGRHINARNEKCVVCQGLNEREELLFKLKETNQVLEERIQELTRLVGEVSRIRTNSARRGHALRGLLACLGAEPTMGGELRNAYISDRPGLAIAMRVARNALPLEIDDG